MLLGNLNAPINETGTKEKRHADKTAWAAGKPLHSAPLPATPKEGAAVPGLRPTEA